MKIALMILKWVAALGFSLVGVLAILWGVFCCFGGPDPGAGSGREGLKYGIVFVGIGVAMFVAARFIWIKLR
jgi:hypothetical protein